MFVNTAAAQETQQQSSDSQAAGGANEPVAWKSAFPVKIIENPVDAAHATEREAISDRHDAEDLDAQVRAADAAERGARASERQVLPTYAQAVFGLLGMGLLFYTLILNSRATNAAVEASKAAAAANKIAQDHFVADQRPWIAIGAPSVSIYSDDGTWPVIAVQIETQNLGRSPALSVEIHVKVEFPRIIMDNNGAVEAYVSELTTPTNWKRGNTVIFPNFNPKLQGFSDYLDKAAPMKGEARLIVCATYKAGGSSDIFHAAKAFRMSSSYFDDLGAGSSSSTNAKVRYIERSDSIG
ncbi:hypothetical protein [Mesorhizobium sp. M0619]|uniref:hypothetical protein n=1 Tax=unclassified Mesorhizobium TaxID=325217 RepID=UPI003336BA18